MVPSLPLLSCESPVSVKKTLIEKKKKKKNGPLWCDEGVYRIAKELQLQNPIKFGNIFLGIGGFHLEKILLACYRVYLEGTGVENMLFNNEIFGPVSVKCRLG